MHENDLIYYFSKRYILLIGLVIFIFGGVGEAFINGSIFQILVLRVIVGIGGGLVVPLCGAYITELWEGDERVAMMGYANGGASLIAIALTMTAGVICMIRWEYTFLACTVFIPIFILEFFAIPGTPPERLNRPVWMLTLCSLIHFRLKTGIDYHAVGLDGLLAACGIPVGYLSI
jgi:MFS family permease